jgi:hypothetical protein
MTTTQIQKHTKRRRRRRRRRESSIDTRSNLEKRQRRGAVTDARRTRRGFRIRKSNSLLESPI